MFLQYLEVKFAIDSHAFVVHQFEGVASIPIHVLISIRNTTITEQEQDLMSGLWTQSDEIPEHVGILRERKTDYFNVTISNTLFFSDVLTFRHFRNYLRLEPQNQNFACRVRPFLDCEWVVLTSRAIKESANIFTQAKLTKNARIVHAIFGTQGFTCFITATITLCHEAEIFQVRKLNKTSLLCKCQFSCSIYGSIEFKKVLSASILQGFISVITNFKKL